jgi:hypothetical protein
LSKTGRNFGINLKGERNQLLICGFTESRTNKKNENMNVVDYVISSSEYSGSKLYATNPISLEFLVITEFQNFTTVTDIPYYLN